MTDPIALRNRFAMVKGAWDEHLRGVPFPSLGEGTAEQKIERLELALVDEMRAAPRRRPPSRSPTRCGGSCTRAPTATRVKQRVTQHHEELARLSARRI